MIGSGPYSFRKHPWCREIHDATAEYVFAQKCAQVGVSETAINRSMFTLAELKRDVLYVLPTRSNASDFSKARFGSAVNQSPYLKNMFVDTNNFALKSTGINNLYIRGSRGDSNLKSVPASLLVLDELDEMQDGQIWLALDRLSGQDIKNVLAISNPTLPGRGINKHYIESTQDHYFFKCPCCGRKTELVWPDCMEICGESQSDARCDDSYLKCKECGGKLPHETKQDWLRDAFWHATNPSADKNKRGFHINQLYSMTVRPGELVSLFHAGRGDEVAAFKFITSRIGIPFIGDGAQVTDAMLNAAIGSHSMSDLRPEDGSRLITLGIDQGKTCYWVVIEWDVPRHVIDLNAEATGRLLACGKFGEEEWGHAYRLMREWQVRACVIDADPQISEARRFARKFPGWVWLSRYRKGVSARESVVHDDGKDAPIATVDRANWLTVSLGRFKVNPPTLILPRDIPQEYRDHVKALVRTYKKNTSGDLVADFVNNGADHFAHATNYAEIALSFATTAKTTQTIKKVL